MILASNEAALGEITSPPGWIEPLATRPGDRTLTPWAVTLRDGGTVAGYCGFLVRPVQGTTLGYAILPQHRGLGLATEAARAAVEWAERHGVDFYASVRPPNPASVRVLTKIGLHLTDSYVDADGQRDIYRRH
jgi:RimJ/RimL family protein N-acetyltransferase